MLVLEGLMIASLLATGLADGLLLLVLWPLEALCELPDDLERAFLAFFFPEILFDWIPVDIYPSDIYMTV